MKRQNNPLRLLPLAVVLCCVIACSDDDSNDDNSLNTGAPTDADGTDSEGGTGQSDVPSPYDDVDCAIRGADPANCESEICFHKQMYDQLLERCGAGCAAEKECYAALADCMKTACPVETLVPEDKSAAGIYTCKNIFDEDCMAQLP